MQRNCLVPVVVLLLMLLGIGGYMLLPRGYEGERSRALDKAYAACEAATEARAQELEDWYLEDKSRTLNMAKELNSMKGKWVMAKTMMSGNKAERERFFKDVSSRYLHSPQDCEKKTAWVVAELLRDWTDAENLLAVELQCSGLGVGETQVAVQTQKKQELDHSSTLQKQIAADIVALVGGEAAAAGVTQLGVSAGILGTGAMFSVESFGISLVVGVVVDMGVDWYLDTEGELRKSLDDQVERMAAAQKEKFRETMKQALKEKRKQWEKEL